jgi:hypothetical protein
MPQNDEITLHKLHQIEQMLCDARDGKNQHWHLKKEVTVAHILSSIGMVAILVAAWFSLTAAVNAIDVRTVNITDARVTALETNVRNISITTNSSLLEIKTELRSINEKLDHKVDRTWKHNDRN